MVVNKGENVIFLITVNLFFFMYEVKKRNKRQHDVLGAPRQRINGRNPPK
jgi:hypothetical protein